MSVWVALAIAAAPGVARTEVNLAAPGGRVIPVRVYAPAKGCRGCTLVIFSHGNFATPERYDVLLDAWAAHGLVVAAPLHTDSEEYPDGKRYPDSRATRFEDWRVVDAAMRGARLKGIRFSGKVVAAGHSYGALIAEVAGGARLAQEGGLARDWRMPTAVVAISPPGVIPAFVSTQGFARIERPTLVVTGTTDVLPGFVDRWASHLDSYEAAPTGRGYALTFDGMNHYFNGAYGRPTAAGSAAAPQVARLNTLVLNFIDAAVAGRAPSVAAWAAHSGDGVTAQAK